MDEDRQAVTERRNTITPAGYRFVMVWAACLLLLYVLGAYFGAKHLRRYAAETERVRQTRVESLIADSSVPSRDTRVPLGAKPVNVLVGAKLNHIGEFALKESAWTVDFDLWFEWKGGAVNPGKDFRLVNGQILQREKGRSYQRGEDRYQEYHLVARMTNPFDVSRFPVGELGLFVQLQDATQGLGMLRYIAAKQNSEVGPQAISRGLKVKKFLVGVRSSDSGRPKAGAGGPATEGYSQFVFGILVEPDSLGLYVKMFQALFASVAIALVVLFIKPIHVDPRFGLPVGGFFAAVGNNIYLSTILPYSDRVTLADFVNSAGIFTIFLILVESAVSLHILDSLGQERLSRFYDRVSFGVFLLGYVTVNLALPLAARPL